MEVTKPITSTDLRKLLDYQFPKPAPGQGRILTAKFLWDADRSGWIVFSLTVNQLRRNTNDTRHHLKIELDKSEKLTRGVWETPLLTHRGKPKVYKTMDALYRDMKAIAGDHCRVLLDEILTEGAQ